MNEKLKLQDLSSEARSLLLYIETRATDQAGIIGGQHVNAADIAVLKEWNSIGFIRYGRLTVTSVGSLVKKNTTRVELSENAWELAHQERRERNKRMSSKPPFCDLIFVGEE